MQIPQPSGGHWIKPLSAKGVPSGVEIMVRVTPHAQADRIDGLGEDAEQRTHLKVRVRAVADKGLANKAVCDLLAKALGIPKTSVSIVKGNTDRLKTLQIIGDATPLHAALLAIAASRLETR